MKEIVELLHQGGYSCVISNKEIRTFTQRGIADLYQLLNNDTAFLAGASIADKVVGKAAAALMILGKVKELYTDIISEPALALLNESDIKVDFGKVVPFIENRDKTDWCPIEKMCYQEKTSETIFPLIKEFITKMQQRSSNT
ncbi:DUF1893 domain-containing protein [Dysgonomonas sp. Marseille-P4677]|uniref:DUF1893 domain-containing protein n=1 Tax=Dysgonomonas sp. Marseille-P4677 TaxID=2364790 RepID=UPI0019138A20|nr:DUF1893 domain-containing protein [Dysgonomonas sp. Marseille-P4677]MBK5722793.1 DUF1893 domain-containing protein [Dysgonomonas sp. Marseille-P4677]